MTIITTVTPVTHDLGNFEVRRAVPSRDCRMVGPFVFVDQFGPAQLDLGSGMDVRPHPHINLATVTWLFEGAIDHRDSLGSFSGMFLLCAAITALILLATLFMRPPVLEPAEEIQSLPERAL